MLYPYQPWFFYFYSFSCFYPTDVVSPPGGEFLVPFLFGGIGAGSGGGIVVAPFYDTDRYSTHDRGNSFDTDERSDGNARTQIHTIKWVPYPSTDLAGSRSQAYSETAY